MKAVKAARIARHILSLPPVSAYVAEESAPGPAAQSDEDIIEYFRVHGRPNNHSVGTCKMGVDDMAVVDPRLRVKGVSGLRVIDASVMPRIVAANTNAATIMIGEKGAAMILEDARRLIIVRRESSRTLTISAICTERYTGLPVKLPV